MRRLLAVVMALSLALAWPSPAWAMVGFGPFAPPEEWAENAWDAPPQPPGGGETEVSRQVLSVPQLGGDWYFVTEYISGVSVSMQDGQVVVTTTTATSSSGGGGAGAVSVPVAMVLYRTSNLRPQGILFDGAPFTYPDDPAFLGGLVEDWSLLEPDIPPAGQTTSGLDRQPIITSGEEVRGNLHTHPRINLVQRLRDAGYSLTPEQIAWLHSLDGYYMPGTLYITAFLTPNDAGTKWRVRRWVYTFEVDLSAVLGEIPHTPQTPPPEEPPPRDPDPTQISDPAKLGRSRSEGILVPSDCDVTDDPTSAKPCDDYGNIVSPWYCLNNPGAPECRGYSSGGERYTIP